VWLVFGLILFLGNCDNVVLQNTHKRAGLLERPVVLCCAAQDGRCVRECHDNEHHPSRHSNNPCCDEHVLHRSATSGASTTSIHSTFSGGISVTFGVRCHCHNVWMLPHATEQDDSAPSLLSEHCNFRSLSSVFAVAGRRGIFPRTFARIKHFLPSAGCPPCVLGTRGVCLQFLHRF